MNLVIVIQQRIYPTTKHHVKLANSIASYFKAKLCLCGHSEFVHAKTFNCAKCTCIKFEIDDMPY